MSQKQTIEISLKTIWYTIFIIAGVLFLFAIRDILLLLFLAIIVSSAIQPLVDRLEVKKIPRTLTASVVYLSFISLLIFLLQYITPIISHEIKELGNILGGYLNNLIDVFNNVTTLLGQWHIKSGDISNSTSNSVAQFGISLFNNTIGAFTGLFKTSVVLSLSFYMIVKKDGAWGFLKSVIPQKYEKHATSLIQKIQHQVGRWMIGQFILVVIIFVLDYLVLSILKVPTALTLAMLGGILEIIPYIGPTVSVIPAVLIALTISPWIAFGVLIGYVLVQQVENHIIVPLLMKKAVGLNPVVIILVLLIGGKLAGIAGMILAVPLAATIGVVWGDVVNRERVERF